MYWKAELNRQTIAFPAPEASPVHFSYRVKGCAITVPYHVMRPRVWEYPYHNGQAQKDLSDRLVPASLYEVKVVRPGYLLAYHGPTTQAQALVACDSGKVYQDPINATDVNRDVTPVGFARQGHQQRAMFVCPQPECSVAGRLSFYFATLNQLVSHWNTFHVAAAPLFKCVVQGYDYTTAAVPLHSLDVLFRHIMEKHPNIYDNGKWHNLVDLLERGTKVKPNTQYWPPARYVGELKHPVAVTRHTATQLMSPILAARWAVHQTFHHPMVTYWRQYRRAQRKESKSGVT